MRPKNVQPPPISERQRKRMAGGVMEADLAEYGPTPSELAQQARRTRWRLEDLKMAKSLGIDPEDLE